MSSLLLSLILLVLLGYIFLHFEAQNKQLKKKLKSINEEKQPIINQNNENVNQQQIVNQPNITHNLQDAIITRDYRVVNDPLVPAVKRPEMNVFPPVDFSRYIDIPTRGYPDSYQYLGNLFRVSGNADVSGEKVVKLFGRQKFPGSNGYEYYGITNDSSTLNYKIPISTKNEQELYDGDIINIPQLGGNFNVNIHPDQTFRYNPLLF
jgi:hypothetical protein